MLFAPIFVVAHSTTVTVNPGEVSEIYDNYWMDYGKTAESIARLLSIRSDNTHFHTRLTVTVSLLTNCLLR